ncbi:MAG TPA: FHA domain-containing protein, partial [Planctomycetota bacterium]|nr:FHA domain-containing protein [Planctomycetota bacterium]
AAAAGIRAAWEKEWSAALRRKDAAGLERLADAPAVRFASAAVRSPQHAEALAAMLAADDAAAAARLVVAARDRGLDVPAASAAGPLIAAVRERLGAAETAAAAEILSAFPLGVPDADAEAARFRLGLWAWGKARDARRRGLAGAARALDAEVDGLLPRCSRRDAERKEADKARAALAGAIAEARGLCAAGRMKAARERLASAAADVAPDHAARDVLAALDHELERDEDSLREAREALARRDLRTARRLAAALSFRRADLGEAELLLHEIEERADRALREGLEVERRTAADPPRRRPTRGVVPLPAGEPFILRVESEGDWLFHPAASLWIGGAGDADADLRVPAAVSSRHARLDRDAGPDGVFRWRLAVGPGRSATVNGASVTEATLSDGDVVALGRAFAFTFRRPSPTKAAAGLKLHGDATIQGCSRVVLFCEEGRLGAVVAGAAPEAVVHLRSHDESFDVFRASDGDARGTLFVRSPLGVAAGDDGERAQVRAEGGIVYSAGACRFYFDPAPPDRR